MGRVGVQFWRPDLDQRFRVVKRLNLELFGGLRLSLYVIGTSLAALLLVTSELVTGERRTTLDGDMNKLVHSISNCASPFIVLVLVTHRF